MRLWQTTSEYLKQFVLHLGGVNLNGVHTDFD